MSQTQSHPTTATAFNSICEGGEKDGECFTCRLLTFINYSESGRITGRYVRTGGMNKEGLIIYSWVPNGKEVSHV